MRRFLSFLIGVLMGALVGASVALLLAPASGDELRSDFQTRYIDIQQQVKDAAVSRRAELENQLAELRKPRKYQEGG